MGMSPSTTPKPLGELEAAIMTVLWAESPLVVRDVHARLRRRPALAYTTVMTVLDRLHAKGLVARVKEGKAFVYRPRISQEMWMGQHAASALRHGNAPPSNGVLMAFLDSAEKADPELVERLSRMLAARKGRRAP